MEKNNTGKFPRLILIFLAVDWPLFMRKKMIIALAESARKYNSTVVAVNRPLCPVTTPIKKSHKTSDLFKKANVEKLTENLFLYSPRYLIHDHIAGKSAFLEKMNLAALRQSYSYLQDQIGVRESNPVVWYYYPQQGYVAKLFDKSFCIYDIYDNLVDIFGHENSALAALQKKQRQSVDLVLTASPKLHDKYAPYYKNARLLGNGLDRETYRVMIQDEIEPLPELRAIKSPRIGYTGLISGRLDYKLIESLVDKRPDYNFIFVGKVMNRDAVEPIRHYDNVHFPGMYDHQKMPSVLKAFDVGFLPYLDIDFFRFSNPLKFYEFAAAGLASISSNMEILEQFPEQIVTIAPNDRPDIWLEAIEKYLEADKEEAKRVGLEIASQHIWEDITDNLCKYIQVNFFM